MYSVVKKQYNKILKDEKFGSTEQDLWSKNQASQPESRKIEPVG
jgi:hypothetical protein